MANRILIEFKQKVTYRAGVIVSDEDYKMLNDADGSDVYQYIKKAGIIIGNPIYNFLSGYADDNYEYDREGEFEDLEISDLEDE